MDDKKDKAEDSSWSKRLRLALSGSPQDTEQLIELLREAQTRELLNADALAMIEGALQISDQDVRDVMLPRSQMKVVERDAPIKVTLKQVVESGHSRFPVVTEDKDKVTGILLAKDLLKRFVEGGEENFSIREYLRDAIFIPESMRLNTLLAKFRESRNHMAIVVDEYGAVSGLVTIEDVLEQIVGDIDDEHDTNIGNNIRQLDDNKYSLRATTGIDEFNEYFGTTYSDDDHDTVAGMIIDQLGRIPKRNEEMTIDQFRFKVTSTDGRRLSQLEMQHQQTNSADTQAE